MCCRLQCGDPSALIKCNPQCIRVKGEPVLESQSIGCGNMTQLLKPCIGVCGAIIHPMLVAASSTVEFDLSAIVCCNSNGGVGHPIMLELKACIAPIVG